MGLFDFFKKKNKQQFEELEDQNLSSNKKVVVCGSSDEFYDKMFHELFVADFFGMPQYECFVENGNIHIANEDNQHGHVAGYVFLWLCNLYKQNSKLYEHILSLARNTDDGKDIIGEDRKEFVLCSLGPKSEQLFSDSRALNAIFIRVYSYHFLIKRLAGCLLSFYSEHQNERDVNYFLSCANSDYLPTKEITNISHFTIQDIDIIFLRDMLGGEKLVADKDEKTIEKQRFEKYNVIWQQFDKNSQLGIKLKASEDFALPYFVQESDKPPKQVVPEKQLLFGILVGYSDKPPTVNIVASKKLFPQILQDLKQGFKYESLEEMILDVSANIRINNGDLPSFYALFAGTEICPKSSKIKFDCAMNLYSLIKKEKFDKKKGMAILQALVRQIDIKNINADFIPYLDRLKNYLSKYYK